MRIARSPSPLLSEALPPIRIEMKIWLCSNLEAPRPIETKELGGFVSYLRRLNRCSLPARLHPFQLGDRMVQLPIDHSFIPQQLVEFVFFRQEEMIRHRIHFRETRL